MTVKTVKNGFGEDAETPFQKYAEAWLKRQVKYAPSTLASYERMLKCTYVYFSYEMETLLNEYRRECKYETSSYDERELTDDDYIFRRKGAALPMTPSSFTWRFKLILRKHGLPESLNVHSLRHTNASLLIAGGTDVTTVAGLLGYAQPSTTLDIYSHAFDKNKREASRAMQAGIEI